MQRKKISTHSDGEDEEEIQMDDKLSEEVEEIGRSNSGSTQVYQKNGFDKVITLTSQQENTPTKKTPQVINLTQSPKDKQLNGSGEANNQSQAAPGQHEAKTLKDKLLNIFTNTVNKSAPQQQQQLITNGGKPKSYALQLEENLVESKGKKGEVHHFRIDNDMDIFEDESNSNKENDKNKTEEEQKKNGRTLFDEYGYDQHPEIEIGGNNSRKSSEDYISLPDSKQSNYEALGKQLTDYESQMQKLVDQQKKQEYDIAEVKKLLSHYDNVKIVKIEQFQTSDIKEVHELGLNLTKGSTVSYDENQVFKGNKEPKKKKGLFGFLTNRVTRYALVHNEYLAFCERIKKNEFRICSVTPLNHLFQLYNDKNSTQLRLYFVNKQRNQYSMPINKQYNIDNKEQFLVELRKAINKIGLDYSLS